MNIVKINNLSIYFPIYRGLFRRTIGHVKAVDKVSFTINKGETLGLVGESGCGKTTIGKALLNIFKPTQGNIEYFFKNDNIIINKESYLKKNKILQKNVQLILQDPFSSLNPRLNIFEILSEPIKNKNYKFTKKEILDKISEILDLCKLEKDFLYRYPHEFSGGQRQRISIARALINKPELVVCDESVSALDVSIQSEIINLLNDLKNKINVSYLFISHDLNVVGYMSDKIAVMYLGKIVEIGSKHQILQNSTHPYTQALLETAPVITKNKIKIKNPIKGEIPDIKNEILGCTFASRCKFSVEKCHKVPPPYLKINNGHFSKCHFK